MMPDDAVSRDTVGRREFVERAAGLLAGAALGGVAPAALAGCASVAATRVTPVGGAIRMTLAEYPQLLAPGGYVKLQPEGGSTTIYVLHLEEDLFAALSPICTHLGCTVDAQGAFLVCPCHGSTYDREGRVVRGPAERPLRRFPTTRGATGDLIIELEGSV